MPLLLFPLGGAAGPSAGTLIDLRDPLGELFAQLTATGVSDLEYWTEDELYRYFDDAAKRLARNAGVFVERNTSITTVIDTSTYNLPTKQISTIHVSYNDSALRAASVQEFEALDETWESAASGTPARWAQIVETIALYPPPDAAETLAIIRHVFPTAVSPTQQMISAPVVLRDYFRYYAQAAARGKESKGAMPEVAAWLGQLTNMYEDVARNYWGTAQ